jgi:hypothetical protein
MYHQVNFPKAITLLRDCCGLAPLLNVVVNFYRIQLPTSELSIRMQTSC